MRGQKSEPMYALPSLYPVPFGDSGGGDLHSDPGTELSGAAEKPTFPCYFPFHLPDFHAQMCTAVSLTVHVLPSGQPQLVRPHKTASWALAAQGGQ